ncbi:MAG: hypothetical protein ABSG88_16565 [Bradyrhizobium sp.]
MTSSTVSRAPAIATKLEIARSVRVALETQIAEAALESAEDVRGADKRLADLRAKMTAADREVAELERAHTLALDLDRRATLSARAKMRQSQLQEFTGLARARDGAVSEIMGTLEKLANAYGRYISLTARAAGSLPIGTSLPTMAIGNNGTLGPAFGTLEGLIAAEAFRLVETSAPIRTALPFAKAPSLGLTDNPHAVPPGAAVFHEATEAVLNEIRTQVESLDATDAASLGVQEKAA